MNTYKIIQEIASTRSRNDKEKILKENSHSIELKEFFRLALSPTINFYQKKKFVQESVGTNLLINSMDWLSLTIASRKITGNEAIAQVQKEINNLSEDDAKIIMHILQKESGCDVGESTINKIWPKLIPTFPCLLATAYDEKLASKLDWSKGGYSQCLSSDWVLEFDSGKKATISEIVNNKIHGKVKSYDESTKSIVYKDITNWFNNNIGDEWFEITYLDAAGKIVKSKPVTGNHKFLSERGWVSVDELRNGEFIV